MIENTRWFHPARYFKLSLIKVVQRMYVNIDGYWSFGSVNIAEGSSREGKKNIEVVE